MKIMGPVSLSLPLRSMGPVSLSVCVFVFTVDETCVHVFTLFAHPGPVSPSLPLKIMLNFAHPVSILPILLNFAHPVLLSLSLRSSPYLSLTHTHSLSFPLSLSLSLSLSLFLSLSCSFCPSWAFVSPLCRGGQGSALKSKFYIEEMNGTGSMHSHI